MKKAYITILLVITIFLMFNTISAHAIETNQSTTVNDVSASDSVDNDIKTSDITKINTNKTIKKDTNTYYVSENGSSTNSGRTMSDSWDLKSAITNIQSHNNSKLIINDATYEITEQLVINSSIKNFYCQIEAADEAIFNANHSTNILVINELNNIKISNITFTNAYIKSNGSAIYNEGKLELNNCNFINNTAYYQSGGAIYNKETLTVSNSNFSGNNAQYGGAIFNQEANLTLTNTTFTSNTVISYSGGAIYNNNTNEDKHVEITSNNFTNNSCEFNGGGALYNNGKISFNNNYLESNYGLHGGAIYNIGTISIDNNTFFNNTSNNGPAIYNMADATLTGNSMINNNASTKGGAIYNMGDMTLTNNTLSNNYSPIGGAIYNALGLMDIESNTITNNTATKNGGAIYNQADMNLENNLIENNTATQAGAIYNQYTSIQHISENYVSRFSMQLLGNVTATNNTFKDNKENEAREIYNKGQMTLENNEFITTNDSDENIIFNDEFIEDDSINGGLMTINNNTFKNIDKIALNNGTMIFTNNTLIKTSSQHITNNSELTYYNNTICKLNLTINIDPVNAYIKDEITINATFVDEIGRNITKGKVVFKVNGITYHDANNNKFFNVTDGKASINYTVGKNLKNITVIYDKTDEYNSQRNTTENMTLKNRTADIKLKLNQTTAKATNIIKITATITENNTKINGGKVVFKLNGVTIKDENNTPIYVRVVNSTASLDYEIPAGLKNKNYTITAVYANEGYDRLEENTTISILKLDTVIEIEEIVAYWGYNASIKAKIYDEYGNLVNKTQKLAVKLNGVTIHYITARNGIIYAELYVDHFSQKSYELTLTVGETSRYNKATVKTTLILEQM